MNPYKSACGYSIIFNHGKIKIVTKEKFDVREGIIYLPKILIQFILEQSLPSPLEFSVLLANEEVGGIIDAICYSPDEKTGFLTLKGLYYISK